MITDRYMKKRQAQPREKIFFRLKYSFCGDYEILPEYYGGQDPDGREQFISHMEKCRECTTRGSWPDISTHVIMII